MKTLDEALDMIMCKTKRDVARVESEAERFAPMVREIAANKRVASLSSYTVQRLVSKNEDPLDLPFVIWLYAFTDGVKIGMEMERQEDFLRPKRKRKKP